MFYYHRGHYHYNLHNDQRPPLSLLVLATISGAAYCSAYLTMHTSYDTNDTIISPHYDFSILIIFPFDFLYERRMHEHWAKMEGEGHGYFLQVLSWMMHRRLNLRRDMTGSFKRDGIGERQHVNDDL